MFWQIILMNLSIRPLYILLAILFFSTCKRDAGLPDPENKANWIKDAFTQLQSGNYPGIKAISWWHEDFDNSLLRINSTKKSLQAYQKGLELNTFTSVPTFNAEKLISSNLGIYHAAFPDFGGTEDVVSRERINNFETLAKKEITWAYFSNNWYSNIQFPRAEVNIIRAAGKVPFIRMMPRSNFDEGGPDPVYTMQKIINGDFDSAITQWAITAASTLTPLLVEFGTEVNGNWFPWNGQYNGGGTTAGYGDPNFPDGPERFRDAYRHIIDICRANGANNITWFFHVDAYSSPNSAWNTIENYYPGDNYIDWLGVSIYGPQENGEDVQSFSEILDDVYPTLSNLANKPIAILEFAVTEFD